MMESESLIEALRAIGHASRFAILNALTAGEMNVGEIETRTGITQPALSQQLAVLRKAGLVETRRRAKAVFYRISGSEMGAVAAALAELAGAGELGIGNEDAPLSDKGAAGFARILPP